ncbi:MAG: hypothetical protein J7K34_07595 [Flavobacteriaceae bacterium]|nr:hypothetical protein [Flavobacteriaceae bacterium]
MKYFYLIVLLFVLTVSCKNKKSEVKDYNKEQKTEVNKKLKLEDANKYVSQSVDEDLANNLRNFLVNEYLKNDISLLQKSDRKFQFYKVDLNDDGNDEIFVRFLTPYFCGTGGCTFLLLDKYGEIITKFTVMRAPIFIESIKENGWSILLVKDSGVFKELKYKNGTYPSNPSMLIKAPYDAPSGHAEVLFDKDFGNAKTYEF